MYIYIQYVTGRKKTKKGSQVTAMGTRHTPNWRYIAQYDNL